MAANGVSRAAVHRLDDLLAVEVVRDRKEVERIVVHDLSVEADQRHAQFREAASVPCDELPGVGAVAQCLEQALVEKLQLSVERFGLEEFFPSVLEQDETAHQRP